MLPPNDNKKLSHRRGTARCVVSVSGKSGPKDQVALYTTTILRLRISARLTRYRSCKFHNGCLTIRAVKNFNFKNQDGGQLPYLKSKNHDI